jgi:uncharacterized protein YgiB involved in biofilm formation
MIIAANRAKRSASVRLTTMAALGTGAMLSACGSDPVPTGPAPGADGELSNELQVFENVFACAKATGKTTKECEAMQQDAAAQAAKEAPRFAAKEDCEAVYGEGQCISGNAPAEEAGSGGRSHFTPFVAAWFSSKRGQSGPLFKSTAGGYQTANGSRLGYGGAPGKYLASNRAMERAKSVPKVKPASKMARAAGFGKPGYNSKSADFGRSARASAKVAAGSFGG